MFAARRIVDAASQDNLEAAIEPTVDGSVLSTTFCDGLLDLVPTEPEERLELGVRWAKKQPVETPPGGIVTVSLDYKLIPFIEEVSNRLRVTRLDAKESFVGGVEQLAGRATADNRREGTVYVRAMDELQEVRRVRLDLPADEHKLAISAYEHHLHVTFRGILRRAGRDSYRIDQVSDFQIVGSHTTPSQSERPRL